MTPAIARRHADPLTPERLAEFALRAAKRAFRGGRYDAHDRLCAIACRLRDQHTEKASPVRPAGREIDR